MHQHSDAHTRGPGDVRKSSLYPLGHTSKPTELQAEKFYFGYGSNTWLQQMAQRCPTSSYLGVGRLPNYRWFINGRGYANVEAMTPSDTAHEVYGLVYALRPEDEAKLDVNEGVPYAYEKDLLEADFWPGGNPPRGGSERDTGEELQATGTESNSQACWTDVTVQPERRKMLVYVDHWRRVDGKPKQEYVYRMNNGIEDAIRVGVPQKYIDKVLRSHIPASSKRDAARLARKQARNFEEE